MVAVTVTRVQTRSRCLLGIMRCLGTAHSNEQELKIRALQECNWVTLLAGRQ